MDQDKKLAIIFPGIGYTADKPLLYYSRKQMIELGYEIKIVSYSGFPDKVMGDPAMMKQSYEIALKQTKEQLQDISFEDYDDIVMIGKSIGTIIAVYYADAYVKNDKIRFVLYTPLAETFQRIRPTSVVFTGNVDPWVKEGEIPALASDNGIICKSYAGANHSLETGNVAIDMTYLQEVIKDTKKFVTCESEKDCTDEERDLTKEGCYY